MPHCRDNKLLVSDFFEAINLGSLRQAVSLLDADCRWWTPGGTLDRAQIAGLSDALEARLATPLRFEIDTVTAEGDRVAVEAHVTARRTNGVDYANVYHFLFRIDDGRIVEVREHSDTAHAAIVWSDLAP